MNSRVAKLFAFLVMALSGALLPSNELVLPILVTVGSAYGVARLTLIARRGDGQLF
jgi:hypothetical protein